MLGSVVRFLEGHPGVQNIDHSEREGVSSVQCSQWEARTRMRIPEDMRMCPIPWRHGVWRSGVPPFVFPEPLMPNIPQHGKF